MSDEKVLTKEIAGQYLAGEGYVDLVAACFIVPLN